MFQAAARSGAQVWPRVCEVDWGAEGGAHHPLTTMRGIKERTVMRKMQHQNAICG